MAHNTDNLAAPQDAEAIRVLADAVEFYGKDSLLGMSTRTGGNDLVVSLLPTGPRKDVEDAVNKTQMDLIVNIGATVRSTMDRIGESFKSYLTMNKAVFWVGILSFVTAVVKGLWSPGQADAIVAAAFGGLSATTFIAYFLSRPLAAVASAGPESAWLLATVNTYWSKLIYLNDPATFVKGVEAAQKDFEESMALYLKTVAFGKRGEPVAQDDKEDDKAKPKAKDKAKAKAQAHHDAPHGDHDHQQDPPKPTTKASPRGRGSNGTRPAEKTTAPRTTASREEHVHE